jgi:hypothetical protein
MTNPRNDFRKYLWVVALSLSLALLAVGCTHKSNRLDVQVVADVQSKINSDDNVPNKQISINASNGVVTLSGNVGTNAARNAAASDAAQVEGVRTVVNNLQIAPAVVVATDQPVEAPPIKPSPIRSAGTSAPPRPERVSAPSPRRARGGVARDDGYAGEPNNDNAAAANAPAAPAPWTSPARWAQAEEAPAPPPSPEPVVHPKIIIPSGTQLSIRMNEEVSSEKAQVGEIFHGSLAAPVIVDGQTVIPTTADVEGRVVDVKSAGRFAGQSVLAVELTRLRMNGASYNLQTDRWTQSGNGRGKATAAKVGGGAVIGAVIGGIFGGGKGAAIGAGAGAGAGTGASAATKGQQIILKPEAVVNFQLEHSIAVTPNPGRQPLGQ